MTEQDQIDAEVRNAIREYESVTGHPASRTWPMIERYGAIGALTRLMQSGDLQNGFKALVNSGKSELTFEAIVLRHPSQFSRDTQEAAEWRLRTAAEGKL